MKKKILIQTPYASDANSFWRCIGPMSYLAKNSEGEIEIYCPPEKSVLTWSSLDQFDLIFMHRPCRPEDLVLMQVARNMNVPVWIDYDDWLFHIPDWNPNRGSYHNPGIQHIMATCLACADIVTTSTQALAKEFLELNKNTILVPNAYRSDLFPFRKKDPPDRKQIFAWRGTNTHEGDLLSIGDSFSKLPAKIHFMGGPPYSVLARMKPESYALMPMTDPMLYWKSIYDLSPKVLLFPLFDLFFNRCKSNIAWIESVHAGALCVAPDNMSEWRHPGVIGYSPHDSESFLDASRQVMGMNEAEVRNAVSDAYEYIRSKYDISIINEIRVEILKSVFCSKFERNKRDPYDQLTGMWALSVLKKQPLPRIGENEKQSV